MSVNTIITYSKESQIKVKNKRYDVGGRFSGTYSGSMNMMGNLGGAMGPIVVGYLLTASGQNWSLIYNLSAGALMLAAVCWLFIDPVTPLAPVEDAAPAG